MTNFKKHKIFIRSIALILGTVVTSCIQDDYTGPDPGLPTRTLLVYLAADNNLSDIASESETLRQAWSYTGNRCLIYYDAPGTTPKLLSLRGGCSVTPVPYIETVAEYAEENSASAEVFSRVLQDVIRLYPADSYGLIFTSHSSGWLPEGTLADPGRNSRSIGSDSNSGQTGTTGNREMELSDFAAAIPDRQFDYIIFESCLMAGVEVAYELRNKSRYLLVSSAELLSPGFQPVYGTSLKRLMNTQIPVEQSLKQMGQDYFSYIYAQNGIKRSATLSVIKTEKTGELAALTGKIYRNDESNRKVYDIANLQHFDRPGSYEESPVSPRYFDFGEYLEQVSPGQYTSLAALLDEIVVWKAATPLFMETENGFRIDRHSGLTTYIEQSVFPGLNKAWRKTAWYKALTENEQ